MANAFTYQVIKDTTEHAVIKLTGKFDGTGQEDNASRIQANTLSGALDTSKANLLSSAANTGALGYYGLSVSRIWYDSTHEVELYWKATTPSTIMLLSGGSGEYNGLGNWVTVPSDIVGADGCNGDIGVRTLGMTANSSYTIIMELRKHNEHYQRGQLNDPAAFNYGNYSLRP